MNNLIDVFNLFFCNCKKLFPCSVSILDGKMLFNVYSESMVVLNKIADKFSYYFSVSDIACDNSICQLGASLNRVSNEVCSYIRKHGKLITIHLGSRRDQCRDGFRIEHEGFVFVLLNYSNTLVVINSKRRKILCVNSDENKLAIDIVRIAKDNIITRLMELNGWYIYHGGAVLFDGLVFLFLGEGGTGKTTSMLQICSQGGYLISNDRVFINANTNEIYGLPEDISVGQGCIDSIPALRKFFTVEKPSYRSSQEKIMFPLSNFSTVFNSRLLPKAHKIDFVLFPDCCPSLELDIPLLEHVNEDSFSEFILKYCLSPYDVEHPHWTEMFSLDEQIVKMGQASIHSKLKFACPTYLHYSSAKTVDWNFIKERLCSYEF